MKTYFKMSLLALITTGLSACETIDEERYASIACKDLKQLVATENLSSLSAPQDSGLIGLFEEEESRKAANIFDLSDKDRRRQAELRAAYRNNCG